MHCLYLDCYHEEIKNAAPRKMHWWWWNCKYCKQTIRVSHSHRNWYWPETWIDTSANLSLLSKVYHQPNGKLSPVNQSVDVVLPIPVLESILYPSALDNRNDDIHVNHNPLACDLGQWNFPVQSFFPLSMWWQRRRLWIRRRVNEGPTSIKGHHTNTA